MIRLAQKQEEAAGMLDLTLIKVDGGTQSRAVLNQTVVDEYADALAEGVSFPPVVVFYDGQAHWLADGFHRFRAHEKLGLAEIAADVRQGTRRDAILFSVGANETHGLRRTNEDKRRAVLTLLNDAEWAKWSDREIARRCNVSDKTVGALRPVTAEIRSERTYTTKHGTTATMNTAAIGKVAPNQAEDQMEATEAVEPAPQSRPRNKFALADGMSIEDAARLGLKREAAGEVSEEIAKELRIGLHYYRAACDVVFLHDRGRYSPEDAALVERAFRLLVDEQQVPEARELVEPVAFKVWGQKVRNVPRADREPARLDRFEHAFGIIMQGCATGAEIDLPYLSVEEAKKSSKAINEAIRNLRLLKDRIERLHQ